MNVSLRKPLFRFTAAICFSMAASTASAIVCQFIPVSGQWNTAANWGGSCAGSVVPGSGDRAEVSGGKTAILAAGVTTVGDVYFGGTILQGAGQASTTLNVVAAGNIAWASGPTTFQDMTVAFTSTIPIPAANGAMNITNAQLILATPATSMLADTITINGASAKIINNGIFNPSTSLTMLGGAVFENNAGGSFSPGATMSVSGPFINNGQFVVGPGVTVSLSNAAAFSQTTPSGLIIGNGTLSAPGQTLTLANGKVAGNPTLQIPTVVNTGAVFAPGGFSAIGNISITGNYFPSGTASLEIEGTLDNMMLPVFDLLVVNSGGTVWGGALLVTFVNTGFGLPTGASFMTGSTYNIVAHAGASGFFSGLSAPLGRAAVLNYTGGNVQLQFGPINLVTSTLDSGPGTLRQVITDLNACTIPNADVDFDFGIGGGVINVLTALPAITCPMNIRGDSNPGAMLNSDPTDWNAVLKVTLNQDVSCTGCMGGFTVTAPNVSVIGINFTNWNKGIRILSGADNLNIVGNYFFQGGIGVSHESGNNALIGDNANPTGRNVFVHTTIAGVQSTYTGGSPPQIRNNLIGLGAFATPGANAKGIDIVGSNGAFLANNVIGNNTKGLVVGAGATGVDYVTNNKFFANGIAVDLSDDGLSGNDEGTFPYDLDTGGNLRLNFPIITSLVPTSGTTADVNFVLKSKASENFQVLFCRNPGGGAQCDQPAATTTGATNASGIFAGTFSLGGLAAGTAVTMAAKATSGPEAGNMSEISPFVMFTPSMCGNTEVTNTADAGLCSLRAAMTYANTNCAAQTITFNIPMAGPHTIKPLTELPPITCNGVTIDGYSQVGSATNTGGSVLNNLANLKIILDGSDPMLAGGGKGIEIQANNVSVKGLAIRSFPWEGILITGNNAVITGNYIGTDPGGATAFGNGFAGIKVTTGTGTQIGDGTPAGINLITANGFAGIQVQGGATAVSINTNMIGGQRNGGPGSSGGEGIDFAGGGNNSSVQANRIHGHAGSGVTVGVGVNAVKISQNRILFNLNKGITNSGNSGIQKPVISSVTIDSNANSTSVSGTYVALDTAIHKVELFANPTTPSVPSGELHYNTALLMPTGAGTFPFSQSAAGIYKNVSATLRRGDSPVSGDTSEFSDFYLTPISGAPALVPFMTPATVNGSQTVTLTNISGAVLSFTSATVGGPGFTKTGDTCSGMMIASLGTCSVTVTFTLPTATTSSGSATFVVLAGGVQSTFINPLSGTTTAAPLTTLSVVPGGLNFGVVPVGQTAMPNQVVTVTNTGGSGLAVTSIPLSGPSQSDYSISDNCISNIIPPAGTCAITLGFTALAAGTRTAQFDVIANTAASPHVVSLTAVGGVAPTITSAAAPTTGTVGVAYTHTFTATGTNPIAWSIVAGAPPTGVTINAASGVLSGTPTAAGTFTFTTQAANGVAPNAQQANTIVIAASIPVITSPTTAGGVTGSAFSYAITATNTPTSFNATGLPAGVSVNTATGLITGTPSAAGTFNAVITATNAGGTGMQALTITVTAASVAPTITSALPGGGTVGTAYTHNFTATGTTPFTWSLTTGGFPTGLTINATTGVLSGTPTVSGAFSFTVQVANGTAPNATQSGTITIAAAALPPTLALALSSPTTTPGNAVSLVFNIANPGATTLNAGAFTFTYPAGVVTATVPGIINTCGGTVVSVAGSTSLTAGGLAISPTGTCSISVSVSSATTGGYTFTFPASGLTASTGSNAVGSSASLTVTVVVSPAVTLGSTSVNFGTRTVNTTSPASLVTLVNSGTANLTISSITGSGDFGFTSTCPIATPPIIAGGTCPINITFTPLTVAALNGNISIVSNAPGSPHTIALSGSGSASAVPGIAIAPSALTFAAQTLNTTSAAQNVTVTNTGFANLSLSSITVSAPFSRVTLSATASPPDCGSSLAPGSSCQIGVTFTATSTSTSTLSGFISISDNAAGSPHTVALTGIGTPIPVAVISVNSPVSFGDQIINSASGSRTVAISNTGTATLTISAITLTGTNAANFTLTGQSGCTSIAAAGSCNLTLSFTPTTTGAKTAQINLTSNAQNAATVNSIALTGNGILAPRAIVNFSATTVGYGNVIFGGATPNQIITLTNSGGLAMSIPSIAVTGDFIQTNNCGSSLAPLATCTINIFFTPLGQGVRFGEFILTTNAATSPDRIQLSGTGCRWFSQAQSRFFLTSCG